ncbi:MAG: M24 family metallopeptidase [Rhodospirillales bacterium]|nr:M24 family metallopeptidase [Rhodospirillales bacterium]
MNGFLIPRADAWPGEFVSKHSERLEWISGFSGSNGCAVVLADEAVVLTDGRYVLQVTLQIDGKDWQSGNIRDVSPAEWLQEHASPGDKIGYDPRLHTKTEIAAWEKLLHEKDIHLVPVTQNPIDSLWTEEEGRPAPPCAGVYLFPEAIAGRRFEEALDLVTEKLKKDALEGFFFTMPDSIAWMLNIRGGDMPHTPVPLSYGLLKQDGSFIWFIDPQKVPDTVRQRLQGRVSILPPADMEDYLKALTGNIGLDAQRSSLYFFHLLETPCEIEDPCLIFKACKTPQEQKAIREAHIRDGRALTEFHRWLKDADYKKLDELTVEKKLEEFRRKDPAYRTPSFDTIAGAGENGAIIHYRATPKTNRKLVENNLLLMDSGGQYFCDEFAGTTDVARVYAIGEPTPEQMHHYTLVLKAHIAVARVKFPSGTVAAQVDTLGRVALWGESLDYNFAGHGVGCFLSVHEYAAYMSPRGFQKLEPGMLVSNEPGLYFPGQYGIRLENLMLVQKTGEKDILGRDMLYFETVTFAPFENSLIDFHKLNAKEMAWLEEYYRTISDRLGI